MNVDRELLDKLSSHLREIEREIETGAPDARLRLEAFLSLTAEEIRGLEGFQGWTEDLKIRYPEYAASPEDARQLFAALIRIYDEYRRRAQILLEPLQSQLR
jgi:hypothetical protein